MPMLINPYYFVVAPSISFTYIGKCTSNGASLNFGALDAGTIAADDLLIYLQGARAGGAPTTVTPSGFTNGINTLSGTSRVILSAKKATGSEGSVTGMDEATDKKIGLVFRPSSAFTSFAFNGTGSDVTDTNPANQTSAVSGTGSYPTLVIGHMGTMSAASISGKSVSPAMTELAGSDAGHIAHYLQYTSGAADVTGYDKNDDGSGNFVQICYLTFT